MEKIYHISYSVTKIPDIKKIGGKAKNLAILSQQAIPVPPAFVLTTDFFEEFMGNDLKKLENFLETSNLDKTSIQAIANQINKLILSKNFSDILKNQIEESLKTQFKKDNSVYFAIRSSATDEDSANFSFAGQLESFLYQRKDENFYDSIKKCFASAYSERAMAYRFANQIPLATIRPAVIVQEMIFGDVSGVLFTGNPLTNNPDHTLINAAFGIGEGIVSGELDSDVIVVDENKKIIKQQIAKKEELLTFDSEKGFGTKKKSVETDKQKLPAITEEQISKLAKIGKVIENNIYNGVPQDIEWCIRENEIFIVQARPITTFSHINKKEYRTIYDNSNIIESYSGVTTPLTFSIVCDAFKWAYTDFLLRIKTPKKSMDKLERLLNNSVGFIKGLLYYNLNAWYTGLQEVPGYNLNRRFMEQMMGVKASVDIEKEEKISLIRRIFIELPRLIRTIFLLLFQLKFINKVVKKYHNIFNQTVLKYMDYDFSQCNNRQLMDIFYKIYFNITKNYGIPIINDFGTMIYYGQLAKFFKKLNLKDGDSLQNDLLAGEGEVESTKPTREIIRISNFIRQNQKLKDLFMQYSEKELIQKILETEDSEFSEVRALIKNYIKLYGDRAMNELKIEESTLREDPAFLFMMIKNYLKKEPINLEEMEKKERSVREKAEKIVYSQIGFMKKRKLNKILKKARFHIKKREELRFMRTKFAGVNRAIFNAIGKNFVKDELIEKYKDICYLTMNETFDLIEGRSVNLSFLKQLISMRKNNYVENQKNEPHERMYFYGDICQMRFAELYSEEEIELAEENTDPRILKGTPCSPGIVSGKVKVVLTPEDANLNGEILVTKRTDPGWVPLFPSISGLIIERGSVLSHSAVVAREMGIPTIVGLRKITEKIKDGDNVKMDGASGLVEKL